MTVRTRVAPSPTGDPHVGTAYVALFNYAFAKQHGGQFILRIEDTDRARSTTESEQRILDALHWVGLSWDEGPDVGGDRGPYRQSERGAIYAEHAEKLLSSGHAFRCFCTPERLTEMRAAQRESGAHGYDGLCANLTQDEVAERLASDTPHVVRLKVPREGVCTVTDHFRGEIEIAWAEVDMQVLVKSDGMPTYHLANVVDDHHMGITHVIRGEEWISSAPKHLLLYDAFGWEAPRLAHLPLLRNPDKSKLSKRKNPTSILFYERMGYLPEALLNYLGMMAFSMPDGEEKFSLEQMVESFDLDRVSMGGPVFDVKKLDWLNGRYIREDLDDAAFVDRLHDWALNRDHLLQLAPLVRERMERLSDFGPKTGHFFAGLVEPSREDLLSGKLEEADVLKALQFGLWKLEATSKWESELISETLRELAEKLEFKLRDMLRPYFVAISGGTVSTPLFDTMQILGPDLSRARIRAAIDVLGGVSKKQASRFEKEFRAL